MVNPPTATFSLANRDSLCCFCNTEAHMAMRLQFKTKKSPEIMKLREYDIKTKRVGVYFNKFTKKTTTMTKRIHVEEFLPLAAAPKGSTH